MGLELNEVADILHLPPEEVELLLEKGDIPHYHVGTSVRFSRTEIEDWLLNRRKEKRPSKKEPGSASPYHGRNHYSLFRALHLGQFVDTVAVNSKKELLRIAADRLAPSLELDPEIFYEMLLEREKMQSTAIGRGVAVPHARDLLLKKKQDQVSVVISQKPIEFGALDEAPVSIFFFPFAATDARHLQLLAKIAYLVADDNLLAFLKSSPDKMTLLDGIESWEKSIR